MRVVSSRFACVRISAAPRVTCQSAFVVARVAKLLTIVLGMPSSSFVMVWGGTSITQNDHGARVSSMFYVAFVFTLAELEAPVDNGG